MQYFCLVFLFLKHSCFRFFSQNTSWIKFIFLLSSYFFDDFKHKSARCFMRFTTHSKKINFKTVKNYIKLIDWCASVGVLAGKQEILINKMQWIICRNVSRLQLSVALFKQIYVSMTFGMVTNQKYSIS